MEKIAVVILNWNGKEMMQQFLPSVVKHSTKAKIIVADNGSTDDSISFLQNHFPTVEVISLAKNYGFAEGYNRALQHVNTEYYLLLNSDVEVTENWLEPLLNYMDEHLEVAACQPKLLAEKSRTQFEYAGAAGGYMDKLGYPFCRGRLMSDVEEDYGQYDTIQSVFWATGAALMVRSKDWHALKGFDSRFFAHMEEIDFCWRLKNKGKQLVCIPQSTVYHVGGGTLNAGNPRKTFLNFRNNLIMLYKNLPEKDLQYVMRWRWWLDYIAATKMLLTDGVLHFKAVIKARKEFNQLKPQLLSERTNTSFNENIIELMPTSLLYLYYCKRIKKYAKLPAVFLNAVAHILSPNQ